jgi:glucan phosphoethanolaminetransferase (alkaline phosphatase superfamily)
LTRDRIGRALLGERPRTLLLLAAPTLFAVVLDVALRARTIVGFAPQGKAIYASSLLVSAAFWVLPLWCGARLVATRRRIGAWLLFALWVMPFATFSFAGQALFFRVYHSYMGRDTVRLGIALRGTVRDWFSAWGGAWLLLGMFAAGVLVTFAIFVVVRRDAPSTSPRVPIFPVLTFAGALVCFWTDNVDSRFLQAATPDACFVHGAVHALRAAVTGKGNVRHGFSIRTPAPLPPLTSARPRPPNVVVILTESVRADALCSDPPPACRDPFFDDVAADRIALGKLTSQTPNTFSASMILFTGLAPNVDAATAHSAPVIWELAHAVGYRTAYVTSQNPNYEDFGLFVRRAGIDVIATGTDLGGVWQEQLGAPDERATSAMLDFIRSVPETSPYLAVLHLSNTHMPYRSDPALTPFSPHSTDPLGDVSAFHNQYANSVRMQERTLAVFIRELRALPAWDDTVVIFLSDHGEQFREHGGLYHNHSLYDEELRVPGFAFGGARGLDDSERASLRTFAAHRTYPQDVNATIVDLLGVGDERGTLPFATLVTGRSLVRPRDRAHEPTALLATETSVWEPDDARFGAMRGSRVVIGAPGGAWLCFDTARDPAERSPIADTSCADLSAAVKSAFPTAGLPP